MMQMQKIRNIKSPQHKNEEVSERDIYVTKQLIEK
jgi:hypothetical protein